ncbi:MAG: hypothetical protein ACLP50_09870 [Solirubrobacteraceae bacterium]
MHFRTRRILPAIVVIGAIAAGGAAYTAGSGFNTVPTESYAGTSISGETASNLYFQTSGDGSTILGVTFNLLPANGEDYTKSDEYQIQAGFGQSNDEGTPSGLQASTPTAANPSPTSTCTPAAKITAVVGDSGAVGSYPVSCTFTPPIQMSNTDIATPDLTTHPDAPVNPNPVPSAFTTGDHGSAALSGADQFNILVTTIGPIN